MLVAKLGELGGVAMTVPVVYDACMANPGIEFVYVTRHHESRVLINAPANLTVVTVNMDNYRGVRGLYRLAKGLYKRYAVTHFVDLQGGWQMWQVGFFLRLMGVSVYRTENGDRAKRELTRPHNKVLVQLKPQTERDKDVFYKAGIALSNDFDTIWGMGGDKVDSGMGKGIPAIERHGPCKGDPALFAAVSGPKREGEHWLAVAPFARHRGKVYPADQMERVIEHFSRRDNQKIFIFGFGDGEREQIAKYARRYKGVVNMAAAELGLAAELSLLSHCDVMLSMDAANMHLASLVGLRVVSVWGATHPYTGFLGWRQRTRDVVQLDMTCRPCSVAGDRPCLRGDYHCLGGITPKMIIDKIEKVVKL